MFGNKMMCRLVAHPLNIVLKILTSVVRHEKETNYIRIKKKDTDLPLLIDNMTMNRENPKESTNLKLISEFSKSLDK